MCKPIYKFCGPICRCRSYMAHQSNVVYHRSTVYDAGPTLSQQWVASQKTGEIDTMLVQCWASVVDGGPALSQHRVNISIFSGSCSFTDRYCCSRWASERKITLWAQSTNIIDLTLNPFKPEFTIVIFIHYKPRIAVAILDL